MGKSNPKIIIINPNSTASMTDGLKPLVETLGYSNVDFSYFTASSGPASINNARDAADSAQHCLAASDFQQQLSSYDAYLVACYSQHPLVSQLKVLPATKGKPVTGIFEASIATALQLLAPGEKFGIVSTGAIWEGLLTEAVHSFLGTLNPATSSTTVSEHFAGVTTTGLTATELHTTPAAEVRARLEDATQRLLEHSNVGVICLGCAGMSGMDETVRSAAIKLMGPEKGNKVRIVDGVMAGVGWLETAVRMGL